MILTVKNEAPFQILSGAFTIGPSPTGYELQVGATPQSFTTLFSVGANTPRMVTNVANGSYYRLKNNVGDVKVNWSRTCIDNQGGGSGTELEPITEFPVGVPEGTVVALASGDTVGVYQYDGSDWVAVAGGTGGGNVIELTRAEYEALTNPDPDTLYIITDADAVDLNDYAPASGLTELSATTTTALAGKADKQNVTARSTNWIPGWNNQGIITGGTQIYSGNITVNGTTNTIYKYSSGNIGTIYGPATAGTAGQPLLSNGSGAPVWGGYKFAFITQTAYDALTTKDATTIYFIIGD